MPFRERVLALDRVLAYVDASRIRPKNNDGVKADPPVVFYSTGPALIVNIDGDPVWSPIPDATTCGTPSTRTGICSSISPRRPITCGTRPAG